MDDDGFLRAVRASPGDNVLRLVYADWLDERADPRGEWLRIDVEVVCLAEEGRSDPTRLDRRQELAAGLDLAWLACVERETSSDWLVGVGATKHPAVVARAIEYVRAGGAPGCRQLVVCRVAAGEYLNLFLACERAMLFWSPGQIGKPLQLIARRPIPDGLRGTEVAFEGRAPHQPWVVPIEDTVERGEGVALLEEYARTGTVPVEVPVRAARVRPFRQLQLFEADVSPEPESLAVFWDDNGQGPWQPITEREDGTIPF